MADSSIATAADYADAMITARRATRFFILLLVLLLLGQLTLFFLVRLDVLNIADPGPASTQPATSLIDKVNAINQIHYLVGGAVFLGVTVAIVLSFVLLLIVNIMLVGRLIGVSRVTRSYILSLVLLVLLFPWQAFLSNVGLTPDQAAFKIPGVLYTWSELRHPTEGAHFKTEEMKVAVLKWTRFAGFPVVAVIILLTIAVQSGRGMKQALGEDVDMPLPDAGSGLR
jgi:hypothetical protein